MSKTKQKFDGKGEAGFTLLELMIAGTLSILVLALVANVFRSQSDTFSLTNELNKMQSNGRAAIDFMSRAVQNAGYQVVRGTRFMAASDHYVTIVFDENDDDTIQDDEVVTFAVSNASGSARETFTLSPYFDVDDDGNVESGETSDYPINLTLSAAPFTLYKIVPVSGESITNRSRIAQNIDNFIVRYYDKDDNPLPAGVSVDAEGLPIPPYVLPADELNDIRRVEIEIMVRSQNSDPRAAYSNTGSYPAGSISALLGTGSYNDGYHRQTFKVNTSPRNLVTAPWGSMQLVANPNPVTCPDDTTTITATLVDAQGNGVGAGITINFNTNDGALSSSSIDTDASGEGATSLTYDWSSPSTTITLSANSLVDAGGKSNPVFNAIPVAFESGTGIFTDNFDDGDSTGWTEEGTANWNVASQQYKTASNGLALSTSGCAAWQDYSTQIDIKRNGSLGTAEYSGMILRYQSENQYYMARIYCTQCAGSPATHVYNLQIVDYDNGVENILATAVVTFANNTYHTLKTSISDQDISAKFWETSGAEPAGWLIDTTDSNYSSGKVGMITTQSASTFDNVDVTPEAP